LRVIEAREKAVPVLFRNSALLEQVLNA